MPRALFLSSSFNIREDKCFLIEFNYLFSHLNQDDNINSGERSHVADKRVCEIETRRGGKKQKTSMSGETRSDDNKFANFINELPF